MEHAKRFRALLADLSLSNPDAAKLLHVSLRTLQNWLSGRHEVPYATFKLLRLLRHMELPGDAWRGWSFARGVLITPEGRTIAANEGAWWSMLVRRSEAFGELYRSVQQSAAAKDRAEAEARAALVRPPRLPKAAAARQRRLIYLLGITEPSRNKAACSGAPVLSNQEQNIPHHEKQEAL